MSFKKSFNKWAAARGRQALIQHSWMYLSDGNKKFIVDNWVESGDISQHEANNLLRR